MMGDFHFIRPYFFILLLIVFWLTLRLYRSSKKNNAWSDVCDPQLLSYLLVGTNKKSSFLPVILLFIIGCLLVVSLAGPTWKKLPQAVYKKEAARVFVLDLSRSMDAKDILPTRASRAKLKLIDLLTASKEGQVALVVYAARSHIVSPLTDDAKTIIAMVPSLSTEIMPAQGSRTDRAILKAAQLLTRAGKTDGEIILLTDGANGDKAKLAARKITEGGYTLNIVGVGTVQGSPIPVKQGGFLKDGSGAIVIPKLDRQSLKELALAGAGFYVDLAIDDSDVPRLIRASINTTLAQDNPLTREVDLWQDEGHWFLLLALPFAALGFRRGWLTMVVVSICYMPDGELYAFEWQDLWQTKDQQAQNYLATGDNENAAQLFENKNWKGTAYYKNGNYEQADEAFSHSNSTEAKYNRANALAKQGKLQEAIDIYDEVLAQQSDHKDAQFNKNLLSKALDQQKQKPAGDEQNKKDDESKDKQQDESDPSQGSDSEKKQSEQNESEQKQDQSDSKKSDSDEDQKGQKNEKSDEEKQQEDAKRAAEQEAELNKDKQDQEQEQSEQEKQQQKEIQQATQQWLRRIPDDPGGLLREKFFRQSQRQQRRQRHSTENPW